jgi:hypothetical protein
MIRRTYERIRDTYALYLAFLIFGLVCFLAGIVTMWFTAVAVVRGML